MKATVIDTLRYANRLKNVGIEPGQAEAMSRALNDELTEGLATKTDLDNAVSELGGKIDALDAKFEVRFAEVDARFAEMEGKFDVRFAEMEGKFAEMEGKFAEMEGKFVGMEGKFAGMDGKFEAVDAKIDGLRSQNRYVFLVLALIAGLGLYNATAPHFLGKIGQPAAESSRTMPAAEVPAVTDAANTSSFVSSGALPPLAVGA
ncbi:MAG: hypothetical protein OXL38_08565 [Gammaproteobacteria bacterium]|nr:hypothetical protein [Gammaproteobacteria bacterium]